VQTAGTVTDSTLYSQAKLKVRRNGVLINTQVVPLVYVGNVAPFVINYALAAELASYTVELYFTKKTAQTDTLLRTATDVVAGDVYIIQGQSNAEAKQWSGDANVVQSPYIRVYGTGSELGSDSTWYVAQGNGGRTTKGNAGQWGLRMARQIVDSNQVPVAIFNCAMPPMPPIQ
jgi:hypothetical protein